MYPYFVRALSVIISLEPSTVTQSSNPQDKDGTSCINFIISGLDTFNWGNLQATTPSLQTNILTVSNN